MLVKHVVLEPPKRPRARNARKTRSFRRRQRRKHRKTIPKPKRNNNNCSNTPAKNYATLIVLPDLVYLDEGRRCLAGGVFDNNNNNNNNNDTKTCQV